jgi:hypothetical protein
MILNRKIIQALVFGFVLAITGCSDDPQNGGTAGTGGSGTAGTGGSGTAGTGGTTGGNVMAGVYTGSDPEVCFNVSADTTQLENGAGCADDAFTINVLDGTPASCDFDFEWPSDELGPVSIENGTFSETGSIGIASVSFEGTIVGDSASGTASAEIAGVTCSSNWTASHQ